MEMFILSFGVYWKF